MHRQVIIFIFLKVSFLFHSREIIQNFQCLIEIATAIAASPTAAPNIIIVGAGLSGYSAAAKLLENGHQDILILEAEGRIGGRVHSVQQGDGSIDLGAQWCHGEKNNAIFELVDKHFHFGRSEQNPVDFIFSKERSINQQDCSKLKELLDRITKKTYEGRNVSIGRFVEQEYEKSLKLEKYQHIDSELASYVKILYGKQKTTEYAADSWFDISAHYGIYKQGSEGDQKLTWNTKGFKTIFEFLSVSSEGN